MMLNLLETSIGRLRIMAFLEGISLITLVGFAVPLKRIYGDPSWVQLTGPIHGILFLIFVFNTFAVSLEYKWKFQKITWKVLLACFIPFGTFYIDHKILRKIKR